MSFSKGTLSAVTVLILIAIGLGGIYWRLRPESAEGAAQIEAAQDALGELPGAVSQQFSTDVAQPVTGARVVRDTLWIKVTAAGEAAAFRRTALSARVAGEIRSVTVRENARVRPDQLMIQIDTTEYALAVARARSALTGAEADYEQLVLFDDEIEDPEVRQERARLARSRSGLNEAAVGVREAELNLSRTRITAPFGGRVADLHVVPGHYVAQGDELLTVVELDPIKVEVQVLEAEIGFLDEGRRATMTLAAFPGETFEGLVETINPVVDPQTRTARVTILLRNPQGRIKPGMYARVSLEAQHFANRVLVPRTAILERDRRTMLFVFDGANDRGRAEWRYVTTGLENDSLVEIVESPETSTVSPDEVVLVDGHHYLVHDAVVQLAETGTPRDGGR